MNNQRLLGELILAVACGCLVLAIASPSLIRAQAPGATFAAVSVKRNVSVGGLSEETLARHGGYVALTHVTARQLIEKAYLPYKTGFPLRLSQPSPQNSVLSGTLPDWTQSEHFDIDARAEGDPAITEKQSMLRSMLEDRFKLAIHQETRKLPVLALVLVKPGKIGPQLVPHSDNNTCTDEINPQRPAPAGSTRVLPCGVFDIKDRHNSSGVVFFPEAYDMTMASFADNLSGLVNRIVVDQTGLKGTFDVQFGYTLEPGQPGAELHPQRGNSDIAAEADIFTALQEQLGLKLQPETAPVSVLVIDHIEEPSPN